MNLQSEITKRTINMIEKKIRYEVNIEKPSKTKPVEQGGVLNYLGKQKTVNAPRHWRSSPKHPIAHLAYITKDEEKILVDLNLYGSLKGKPNRGPSGIMSLNGGGGGSEGAGSDTSGTGAAEGTAQGPGPNEAGVAGEAAANAAADAAADAAAAATRDSFSPDIGGIVGPGPGQLDMTNLDTVVSPKDYNLVDEETAKANLKSVVDEMKENMTKDMNAAQKVGFNLSINNPFTSTFQKAVNLGLSPLSTTLASFSYNPDLAGDRGYTDYGSSPSSTSSDGGGGITTIQSYAPLSNTSTGDNTADSIRKRLEDLLVQRPTSYVTPTASQLSNYNLLDLVNLRR
jgi:hypothetical protein